MVKLKNITTTARSKHHNSPTTDSGKALVSVLILWTCDLDNILVLIITQKKQQILNKVRHYL